ncbi:hypothetical protein [Ruficoccus sp. ZRK36]|uniref:hypothetical protein n=1 Tax=Ruficoccus sp. ZRK36 TaxID=2866311 RepID=UPI001C7372A8|nr:hypothetical protein [Ruficoccus sp. ZRK36]QYY37431.1 hypothetical protein K0V07_08075 [Ruficoccus sp. ZRK36]
MDAETFRTLVAQLASRYGHFKPSDTPRIEHALDWRLLSLNQSFEWSWNFISARMDRLDLYNLSSNPSLPWSVDKYYRFPWHRAEFSKNIGFPWTDDFLSNESDNLHWKSISNNASIYWCSSRIERFRKQVHYWSLSQNRGSFWSIDFIYSEKESLNWLMMADNPALPWSSHVLQQLTTEFLSPKERLNLLKNASYPVDFDDFLQWAQLEHWNLLSQNEGFCFSNEIMDKFTGAWNWNALSANRAVPWDHQLVMRYADRINWERLAINPGVQWDHALLNLVHQNAGFDLLLENPGVWQFISSSTDH